MRDFGRIKALPPPSVGHQGNVCGAKGANGTCINALSAVMCGVLPPRTWAGRFGMLVLFIIICFGLQSSRKSCRFGSDTCLGLHNFGVQF